MSDDIKERLKNPCDGWSGDVFCVSAEDAAMALVRIEELESQLAEALAALQFYKNAWTPTSNTLYGGLEWKPKDELLNDCGNRASAAIDSIQKDTIISTAQPDFDYFECPECGFSSVQKKTFTGSEACPLCAGDSGHDVGMNRRTCLTTDQPEGRDARKHTDD